jgi:hypothetical protein
MSLMRLSSSSTSKRRRHHAGEREAHVAPHVAHEIERVVYLFIGHLGLLLLDKYILNPDSRFGQRCFSPQAVAWMMICINPRLCKMVD